MRVPWNKGIKLKDNPKYSRMGFQKGHTHHLHENCKKTQFQAGESLRIGMTHTEESRQKMSKSRRGQCMKEKNPSWKGGVTPLVSKIKRLPEYSLWRRKVLEKDNFTCQSCGARGGQLNPHHLVAFSYIVRQAKIEKVTDAVSATMLWELENGVTLCEPCHKNTPNYGYRAGANPVDETVYSLTNSK